MTFIDWMRENQPPGLAQVVVPYIIVVLTVISGFTGYTALQTQDFAHQLRAGLVHSCDVNGNPLREVVQGILKEQIVSSAEIPPSYFPNIPKAKFYRLVREQREHNEMKIKKIAPIDCSDAFPR
jgi:hypothetical protein